MWVPSPSLFRQKLGVGGFFPIAWRCAGSRDYDENVSQSFLPILMLACSCLANGF